MLWWHFTRSYCHPSMWLIIEIMLAMLTSLAGVEQVL